MGSTVFLIIPTCRPRHYSSVPSQVGGWAARSKAEAGSRGRSCSRVEGRGQSTARGGGEEQRGLLPGPGSDLPP